MPPLKVFYLIGTLDIGGSERQLVRLVTRLDRTRFSPVVCCLSAAGALEPELRNCGIPVHVVGFRGLGPRRMLRNLPALLREMRTLFRLMRDESPDIVHGFLFWAYVIGAFTARAAGVPVVIASRRSLSLFKGGRLHYLALEQVANRMTDLFIANSNAVRDDVVRTERIRPERVLVIHNGLDEMTFLQADRRVARETLGIPAASPVAAVISNFIPYKGHEYFIAGWRRVIDEFPDAVALLAGEGAHRGEVETAAHACGIAGTLRFLGSYREVSRVLAAADVFVHPSLQEGFSNAIIEAMAAGKPVVATAVGGNVEAVDDGVTGFLVPPANPDALADGILRLFADQDLASAMGSSGRSKAVMAFELSAMVKQYETLYERLAQSKRTGTSKPPARVAM